jgi:hypothetical protein
MADAYANFGKEPNVNSPKAEVAPKPAATNAGKTIVEKRKSTKRPGVILLKYSDGTFGETTE